MVVVVAGSVVVVAAAVAMVSFLCVLSCFLCFICALVLSRSATLHLRLFSNFREN